MYTHSSFALGISCHHMHFTRVLYVSKEAYECQKSPLSGKETYEYKKSHTKHTFRTHTAQPTRARGRLSPYECQKRPIMCVKRAL